MKELAALIPALVNTAIIYILLIAGIRVMGRRQTDQLSALDLLIILLLGSAVETALIGPKPGPSKELFHDPNTSLQAGLVSAATLMIINRLLGNWLRRSKRFRHLISGGTLILVHNGRVVQEHLYRAGMTEANLLQTLRSRGYISPEEAFCAVLEPNGEVHVVPRRVKLHRPESPTKAEPDSPSTPEPG